MLALIAPIALAVRDAFKAAVCKANNIALIRVPFWWKGDLESLLATIHKHRPDLVPFAGGDPIPEDP